MPLFIKLLSMAIAGGLVVGNQGKLEEFFNELLHQAQYVTTAADMRSITNMLDLHYMRKGRYPSKKGFEGWMRASFKASPARNVLKDNWGHLFVYTAGPDFKSFELVSAGADGILGTEDDMMSFGP
jgi:general secretion pathway protein G